MADVERTQPPTVARWWVLAAGLVVLMIGAWALPPFAGRVARAAAGIPTPGHEAAAHPLGTPAVPAFPGTSYAFLARQQDGTTPIAWDPCRPLHYVVRQAGAPLDGDRLIAEAVRQISGATGLRFVDDGDTDEFPAPDRPSFQPERYGDRWAPVLIAWQSAEENADFATDVVGQARSISVSRGGGPEVYVTGQIRLDAQALSELTSRREGIALARSVIQHELGHLVGLAHVDDPMEVMFPQANQVTTQLGPGDLTGLAALGRGACVKDL